MPKFIKTITDRIQLANRKGLSPYYSPEQISEEIHTESLNLWKKYVQEFERTQLLSVYMDAFREKETVTLTAGVGTLVDSLQQYRTAIMLPTSDIEVKLKDIGHWASAVNDSVRVPTADYPIAKIDNSEILVRPITITSVIVHYLKTPTKPVYAYTVVSEDYVYDDASSVDFEWAEMCHDAIANRVLANLGISQKQQDLIQYSNLEQQKEDR